jgi:hypothetical protein
VQRHAGVGGKTDQKVPARGEEGQGQQHLREGSESLEHFCAELSNFLPGERDVHAGVRSAET